MKRKIRNKKMTTAEFKKLALAAPVEYLSKKRQNSWISW